MQYSLVFICKLRLGFLYHLLVICIGNSHMWHDVHRYYNTKTPQFFSETRFSIPLEDNHMEESYPLSSIAYRVLDHSQISRSGVH